MVRLSKNQQKQLLENEAKKLRKQYANGMIGGTLSHFHLTLFPKHTTKNTKPCMNDILICIKQLNKKKINHNRVHPFLCSQP